MTRIINVRKMNNVTPGKLKSVRQKHNGGKHKPYITLLGGPFGYDE